MRLHCNVNTSRFVDTKSRRLPKSQRVRCNLHDRAVWAGKKSAPAFISVQFFFWPPVVLLFIPQKLKALLPDVCSRACVHTKHKTSYYLQVSFHQLSAQTLNLTVRYRCLIITGVKHRVEDQLAFLPLCSSGSHTKASLFFMM